MRTTCAYIVVAFSFITIFVVPSFAQEFSSDWDEFLRLAEDRIAQDNTLSIREAMEGQKEVRGQVRAIKEDHCVPAGCLVQIKEKCCTAPKIVVNEISTFSQQGYGTLFSICWDVWEEYDDPVAITAIWRDLNLLGQYECLKERKEHKVFFGECSEARNTHGRGSSFVLEEDECLGSLTPEDETRLFSTLPEAELAKVRAEVAARLGKK